MDKKEKEHDLYWRLMCLHGTLDAVNRKLLNAQKELGEAKESLMGLVYRHLAGKIKDE